jgi:predicted ATP-dependent endonuclease of OLD family
MTNLNLHSLEIHVQVFATTHSLDCIKAFQEAARANAQEAGILIRLENKKGEINAVLYEEEELATAAQAQKVFELEMP